MDWARLLFSFSGRITRKAFWAFVLIVVALNIALFYLLPGPDLAHGPIGPVGQLEASIRATPAWQWLLMALTLYISLAVYTKRWHDQNRSGWWNLLLLLTPLLYIGPLIMLGMLGLIPGTPGANRYGERPIL